MIDEDRTMQLFGYTSDKWLPKSVKSVVAVCEGCGRYRILAKKSYRNLCISCVRLGDKHHSYGKKFSKSHCQNMSASQTGEKNHNYGKSASISTRQKMSESRTGEKNGFYGNTHSEKTRRKVSATKQGISYDDWESYATNSLYCPKFNDRCKESNREKYGRHCFLTGEPESANVNKSGKMSKLSVHHVDMDKMQGCNGTRWKLVPMLLGLHGRMHNETWLARIEYLIEHVWYPDGVWTPDALC